MRYGERQRTWPLILPILIVLGFVGWPGWWLWAFMAGLWGFGILRCAIPMFRAKGGSFVGWIAVAVFVLTFAPFLSPSTDCKA